jgi:hypothetical protein
MDAKAVADQIYREHSITATEQEVLDAQAWLQEERRINETPPATEKKDENTSPVTPPTNLPTTGEHQAGDVAGGLVGGVGGSVPAASPPSTSSVPAPLPSQKAEMNLVIPEGVPKIPPILVIDDLIRRGYRSRDDLEDFMKANFEGKAYRDEVRERLQLFKNRQPPFNDIEVTPPPTPPVTPPTIPPATTPPSGGNPPNTGISPDTGGVGGSLVGGVGGGVAGAVLSSFFSVAGEASLILRSSCSQA